VLTIFIGVAFLSWNQHPKANGLGEPTPLLLFNIPRGDPRDWEAGFAERIEGMPEVLAYVKNHSLNFEVPYDYKGSTRKYRPDYIVRVANGGGEPLNLVVEIKGARDEADAAKADTMRKAWLPAVNAAMPIRAAGISWSSPTHRMTWIGIRARVRELTAA